MSITAILDEIGHGEPPSPPAVMDSSGDVYMKAEQEYSDPSSPPPIEHSPKLEAVATAAGVSQGAATAAADVEMDNNNDDDDDDGDVVITGFTASTNYEASRAPLGHTWRLPGSTSRRHQQQPPQRVVISQTSTRSQASTSPLAYRPPLPIFRRTSPPTTWLPKDKSSPPPPPPPSTLPEIEQLSTAAVEPPPAPLTPLQAKRARVLSLLTLPPTPPPPFTRLFLGRTCCPPFLFSCESPWIAPRENARWGWTGFVDEVHYAVEVGAVSARCGQPGNGGFLCLLEGAQAEWAWEWVPPVVGARPRPGRLAVTRKVKPVVGKTKKTKGTKAGRGKHRGDKVVVVFDSDEEENERCAACKRKWVADEEEGQEGEEDGMPSSKKVKTQPGGSAPPPPPPRALPSDSKKPKPFVLPKFTSSTKGWSAEQEKALLKTQIKYGANMNWPTVIAAVEATGGGHKTKAECGKKWERMKKMMFG